MRHLTESAPLIGQADDDRLVRHSHPIRSSASPQSVTGASSPRAKLVLEPGMPTTSIFVVLRGALVIVRSSCDAEAVVARVETGRFTGEVSVLAGQPSMIFIRAAESSEVIEIGRERVLELVKNDSELSDLFMRVFLMRRVELFDLHIGDVVAIGSNRNADMLRVREFLERNNHPYREGGRRSRPGCPDAPRPFSRHTRGLAGAHLPRTRRAAQPDEPARSPTASA